MTLIQTEVKFEAGHRQYMDTGKCGFLHGHNYKAVVTIECDQVNDLGYVIDFKVVHDIIVNTLDHRVILHEKDPLSHILATNGQRVTCLGVNPTAENIATFIVNKIVAVLYSFSHSDGSFVSVKLWENDHSWAEVDNFECE